MPPKLPRGGFHVVVSSSVDAYIAAEIRDNFRVDQFWKDVLARIKFTALEDGTPLASQGVDKFTFIADGLPEYQIPTIQIVYECFDEMLTVSAALVWQEADYEDDEGDSEPFP